MKKQFVIECDTDMYSAFVYEITSRKYIVGQDGAPDQYVYARNITDERLFNTDIGPKFYGKLDKVLFTKNTIALAEPIEPEIEPVPYERMICNEEKAQ